MLREFDESVIVNVFWYSVFIWVFEEVWRRLEVEGILFDFEKK